MPRPRGASAADALPLSEAAFEILLTLSRGERHGYAIMQHVAERTGGRVALHPGTLYRALSRMLAQGWIEEMHHRRGGGSGDERRRYYRITALGREIAGSEARRLASQVAAARASRLVTDSELS